MMNRDPPLRVLHIAGNYPDPNFVQPTTNAVRNLIDATRIILTPFVVSIHRRSAPEVTVSSEDVLSVGYIGFPAMVGMSLTCARLRRRIEKAIASIGFDFDVIHAHKLTVEGVVAQQISRATGKPYVVTVRGYTDGRLMRWRPDAGRLFRDVLLGSKVVFFPAPWARQLVARLVGEGGRLRQGCPREVNLPNVVSFSEPRGRTTSQDAVVRFVTAFRAGQGADKGFRGVLLGLQALRSQGVEVRLYVIGCEEGAEEAQWPTNFGLQQCVSFLGKMTNQDALCVIGGCDALVLPSRNDTFGMVYVEALLSGVPILYSANAGIDGYLDTLDVGIRVDPRSAASVVAGMLALGAQHRNYQERLESVLAEGGLDFFRKQNVAATYVEAIRQAVTGGESNGTCKAVRP